MCLAVFEWSPNSEYPLRLVANRDEFRARPTAPMAWWPDNPILAGKDLEAGGTWLGVSKDKKFALLTNIRPGFVGKKGELSRGHLVSNYLKGSMGIEAYHQQVLSDIARYAGFNLILGDTKQLFWFSSNHKEGTWLTEGIHAVSNDALNTPWPKLLLAKKQLMEQRELLTSTLTNHGILQSAKQAARNQLPITGVPLEWEEKLSAQTINGADYGTRCRTHMVLRRDHYMRVAEQQIDQNGNITSVAQFEF